MSGDPLKGGLSAHGAFTLAEMAPVSTSTPVNFG
jgi:hypothetical protein